MDKLAKLQQEQPKNFNSKVKPEPHSMPELMKGLAAIGEGIRQTFHKNKLDAKEVFDIINCNLSTAVIGENSGDLENSKLYFYHLDQGIYTSSERTLERLILKIEPTLTIQKRKEVRAWLRIEAPGRSVESSPNLVPVGNGIYNKKNNTLLPFSPGMVFTTKVATKYRKGDLIEPEYNGWKFSAWIEELANGDPEKITLIWQMIASVVQNRKAINVLFALVDEEQGRTGKSTFEQLLMELVGADNYRPLKLQQFDEAFLLAQAADATLIVGDDNNPKGYIDDGSNLKSCVTGELVLINPKGMKPFSTRFNATIVQSMNGFPRFKDTSGALYRRFRMILFNHQYPDTPEGRKIKDDYIHRPALLEWILKKALTINIDTIIETKESQRLVKEARLDNDPVLYFVKNYLPELKSTRVPIRFLFNYFLSAMEAENSPQRIKQQTFTRQLKPLLENAGWQYVKNNLAPLDKFNDDDMKLIKSRDKGHGIAYNYLAEIDKSKQQPLIEKLETTNEDNVV